MNIDTTGYGSRAATPGVKTPIRLMRLRYALNDAQESNDAQGSMMLKGRPTRCANSRSQ